MEKKGPLLRQLADNVRRLRKERGLSLAEVSSRMEALGVRLSLNGINKIELGNREVSLDEVAALAAALLVPPVMLLFPLGQQRTVELLPGREMDTWTATKWFTGEAPFPWTSPDAPWISSSKNVMGSPPALFREQDHLLDEWRRLRRQLEDFREMAASGAFRNRGERELSYAERTIRVTEEQFARHRAAMREAGLDPGELPPDAAHLDERQG